MRFKQPVGTRFANPSMVHVHLPKRAAREKVSPPISVIPQAFENFMEPSPAIRRERRATSSRGPSVAPCWPMAADTALLPIT